MRYLDLHHRHLRVARRRSQTGDGTTRHVRRMWPIEERARLAFADPGNEHAARNRDFFFHAFDTWVGVRPGRRVRGSCSPRAATARGRCHCSRRRHRTCSVPASPSTAGREFSLAETLLLFAVLLARQAGEAGSKPSRTRRLRTLRNIAESAFLDRKRMAEYVGTTERLILSGTLDGAPGIPRRVDRRRATQVGLHGCAPGGRGVVPRARGPRDPWTHVRVRARGRRRSISARARLRQHRSSQPLRDRSGRGAPHEG